MSELVATNVAKVDHAVTVADIHHLCRDSICAQLSTCRSPTRDWHCCF